MLALVLAVCKLALAIKKMYMINKTWIICVEIPIWKWKRICEFGCWIRELNSCTHSTSAGAWYEDIVFHTYGWFMARIWNSETAHMKESPHTHQYSLLHLECHFFNLKSQSMFKFSRSLLPRSVANRPMRLRLEMKIEWYSKCNGLYIHSGRLPEEKEHPICSFGFTWALIQTSEW